MICVACFDITQLDSDGYRRLYAAASAERRQRADRYLRQEDKLRCIAADALLRYAVGGRPFTVTADANGKPRLADEENFHFNLSHSGRWVVIAYGDQPVGIDVQKILPEGAKDAIARRFFTADEREYLLRSGEASRFFEIWTAKESYLKYLGTGLRQPLDSFSVLPDQFPRGLRLTPIPLEGYSLTLCAAEAAAAVTFLNPDQMT